MKRKLLILICFVLVTMVFAGCSAVEAIGDDTIVWRMGHEEVAGSIQDMYAQEFKRLVEEKSNGDIEVEVYRADELGGATDYVEFTQGGLFTFGIINPGSSATTIPENNIFYNHFLLPENTADLHDFINESEGVKHLNEINEEHGFKVLDWFQEGFNAWTANNEIRSPEDFKGVRIRTMGSPLILASYNAYKASTTTIAYMELYSALQLGQVDSQVNPLFAIEEMAFYEVQDYLIQAKQDNFIAAMIANSDAYDKMSEKELAILDEVIPILDDYIYEAQEQVNVERLEKIREDSDIKIIELTAEEREQFRLAAEPVRELYRGSVGERGNKILDIIEAEMEEYRASLDEE